MPTIKVTYNGAEIEVQKPTGVFTEKEIAERYVPLPAHNDQMARMRRDLDAKKGFKNPDELLTDTEFRSRAVKEWGLDPNSTKVEIQETLKRRTQELEEREIKPRDAKLQVAEVQISSLRAKDLRGQIIGAAAEFKIEEKYLKSPTKGGKPLIVSMLEDAFAFDGEHTEWFARGENGNAFRFSQSGDVPYQTVREFMAIWVSADGKDFIRSERQPGPNARTGEGATGQVGKELRLTQDQIRDISFFKKMQTKAEKEGLTIVPV